MKERTLEERLRDALVGEPTPHGFNVHFREMDADVLALAISTALTLAERRGYTRRAEEGYTGEAPAVLAAVAFPLPSRTVRTLREEPDPHGFGTWTTSAQGPQSIRGRTAVHAMPSSQRFDDEVPPLTVERAQLALNLLLSPFREVSAPVDPDEILP